MVVLSGVILAAGGCTDSEPGATTTATTPTTSAAVTTTIEPATSASTAATTSVAPQAIEPTEAEGPQPLRGTILQPGDFVTTVFEPRVHYRIVRAYPLTAFQSQHTTGLQNRTNYYATAGAGVARYKGVVVHNWWLRLTPEEVLGEIEKLPTLVIEAPRQLEFNGLPVTAIEATALTDTILWENRQNPRRGAVDSAWTLEIGQRIRLMIVSTHAGSLLITIQANENEWDDFLPIAEEILAGISFPDLESG